MIGFKPENVFVGPVSLRDDWFHEPKGVPTEEPTILWLGKLRRYKCPHHVLEAMPEVLRHVSGAKLVIAGRRDDLDYERELRRLAERLGVSSSVDFQFDLTEAEKRQLIRNSRILVMPSAVEGFGIVALEANAFGVPVVASSGVPEGAVREGFNGLHFPFGDVSTLAAKVVQLLQDRELYSKLSQNAQEHAELFSWSRVGPQFEQVVARSVRTSQ
jgi:glycosyltransferase involved in cell wall biosynthesis